MTCIPAAANHQHEIARQRTGTGKTLRARLRFVCSPPHRKTQMTILPDPPAITQLANRLSVEYGMPLDLAAVFVILAEVKGTLLHENMDLATPGERRSLVTASLIALVTAVLKASERELGGRHRAGQLLLTAQRLVHESHDEER